MKVYRVESSSYETIKSLKLLEEMDGKIVFNDSDNTVSIPEEEIMHFEALLEESLCMEGFDENQEKLTARGEDIDIAIAEILFGQKSF